MSVINIDKKSVISRDEYLNMYPDSKWCDYWDNILEPLYLKEYWKIIDEYNIRDLVEDIFNRFDFETVEKYMQNVNWIWVDKPTSPTIDEMKSNILELISTSITSSNSANYNPSNCSSGGFYISLYKTNNIPSKIEVVFDDNDRDFKIQEETEISIIRKKKLEIINTIK